MTGVQTCALPIFDFPAKTQMLGLDLLIRARGGEVRRLTQEGLPGAINLPRLADELYASARCLRVFTRERADAGAAVRQLLTSA